MRQKTHFGKTATTVGVTLSVSIAACSAPDSNPTEEAQAEHDVLAIGSRGADVAALHARLAEAGYLYNEQLASSFPWSRAAGQSPAQDDVYDERSASAVAAFQRSVGVASTGVADALTRAYLEQARCGTPDHRPSKSNEKFALWSSARPSRINSFKFMTCASPGTPPPGQCPFVPFSAWQKDAIRRALSTWAATTDLTFTEVFDPTTSDIQIHLTPLQGLLGVSAFPPGGWINFNSQTTWSDANPSPAGAVDLETIAVHEIGHVLGLEHSSVNPDNTDIGRPAMWASAGPLDRTLAPDDRVAVSAFYDAWQVVTGTARDIGAAITAADTAWVVGTNVVNGGYGVHRSSGMGFVPDSAGGGGVRIAVDANGVPWVVNDVGAIYRRSSSSATSGSWSQVTGCAKDIAIGGSGAVFTIGCTATIGGFAVEQFNPATNAFQSPAGAIGGGVRIAVHSDGQPWVVNSSDQIWRRSAAGAWTQMPGSAKDISVDGDGYVYAVGTTSKTGGYDLYMWNEQVAALSTGARSGWIRMTEDGVGTNIAVGANGRVWTTDSANVIRRTTK